MANGKKLVFFAQIRENLIFQEICFMDVEKIFSYFIEVKFIISIFKSFKNFGRHFCFSQLSRQIASLLIDTSKKSTIYSS